MSFLNALRRLRAASLVGAVVMLGTCSENAHQPEMPVENPAKTESVRGSGEDSRTQTADRVHLKTTEEILALFKQPDSKAVVANFWATWCGPCRIEMPELIRFYKEYTPRGVRFVSVSADDPEATADKLIPYMKKMEIPFDVYLPKMGESPATLMMELDPAWRGAIPATFVFDPSGNIVKEWIGTIQFEDLAKAVKPLLKG